MQSRIRHILSASADVKTRMSQDRGLTADVARVAGRLIRCVQDGGTVYTCGNGGSACDAMHFAEELVARYKRVRPGIRARHLLDAGILTCWSNDESFETAFARQVETLCRPEDVLVAFSTSGNSSNVVQAVEAARDLGTATIGLLGKGGGRLKDLCDLAVIVPDMETERIQEAHITLVHVFCELMETASDQGGAFD